MNNKRRVLSGRKPFAGISLRGFYDRSWKTLGHDLWKEISEDNLFTGSAALAYYLTLALFPAMIFILGLLPYIHLSGIEGSVGEYLYALLPNDTAKMLDDTLKGVLQNRHSGLLSLGAILTIWAASSGLYSLMQELNITYDVQDSRPFWKTRLTAFLLTIAFGVLTVLALALTVAGDNLEHWLSSLAFWNGGLTFAYITARWIFVITALSVALALVYYFGPDVEQRFIFITPGSVVAVVLLLAASLALKTYVGHFGNYNATYGGIGAVIVLMLWLNILGFVALLGSEVNALLEHYSPEGKAKGQKELPGEAA
jgi:membrane protein